MAQENYSVLIQKLDEFTRKFYKNQLLRGIIYFTGVSVLFFIAIAFLEHFGRFGTSGRAIIFYLFLFINIGILARLILVPLLKLYRLGSVITHEQAAFIIGEHFSNVRDKLLNILQLKQQQTVSPGGLITASIDQKISELKPVPFTSAIDLSQNRRYLKYALPPVLIFLLLLIISPAIITGSTKRIVDYENDYTPPAPFGFSLINKELKTPQLKDFELKVKTQGELLPNEVFIMVDGVQYRMEKSGKTLFTYTFKNVLKSTPFYLTADGIQSRNYELVAIPAPSILNFNIKIEYPAYIQKKSEIINNTGDLQVPAGTRCTWTFNTENTEQVSLSFSYTTILLNPADGGRFQHSSRMIQNDNYSVTTSNNQLTNQDSVHYTIAVVADQFPVIHIEEKKDSLVTRRLYFKGDIRDDYGFNNLTFNYSFISDTAKVQKKALAFNKSINQQQFYHTWDLASLGVSPGDEIEYYFEVWDNDGVSGSKSARSEKRVFKIPTLDELASKSDQNNSKIKNDLDNAIKNARQIQKDLNDLNKKMLEKKALSWEEKKKLQDILDKQKELQKQVENVNKQNDQNLNQQQEFEQPSEELAQKQEQLNELFEKVMSPEMKELLKEMEKMLEQLDKNKTQELVEKMKMETKDLEKELDRNLELFKQLEFEKKLDDIKQKLEQLAQKQEDLSEKSLEKNADNKKLDEKQQELNKEFQKAKEDLKELDEKNKELENPHKMENTEQQQEQVSQDMEKSSESLQDNKNKKASESQKKAASEMQKMSEQMAQMQMQMQGQQNEEDMNALREILENLLQLSFSQEDLLKQTNSMDRINPQYVKIAQQQKKLKDDAKMIEDSLFALSKRQVQIQSFVNKEIGEINANIEDAIKALAERQSGMAAGRQQFVMTGINNLALLLSESLQKMQQQAQSQSKMSGSGSCKKPGGGSPKPNIATMRQMQQQLNEQMQKLKEGMNNPGGKKDGKGGQGQQGMSEELAKMAAQQQALRQMLQKAADQLNKDGKQGNGNLQKIADQMDKTETDLVNKRITQETLKRQQEILTKLLEAEKSERERELDEKRQSNEGVDQIVSSPKNYFEYQRKENEEAELLRTAPPSLQPFYKNKVNEYFNKVNQ